MDMNFSAGKINVLVAYDNFGSGCRAMTLLKRIAGRGRVRGELTHVMWRFDLMADAAFFELAVSAAVAANVVVIATAEEYQLPRTVREWVVQWLLRKADVPQALVATFEHNPAKASGHGRIAADLETLAGPAREFDFGRVQGNDWAMDSALVRPQAAGQN